MTDLNEGADSAETTLDETPNTSVEQTEQETQDAGDAKDVQNSNPSPAKTINEADDDEFADVTLDNFELDDIEDAKEAVLDLLKKKKKAYKQAKNDRIAKEQALQELENLRSNLKMAENEELEALKAQLQQQQQALQEAQDRIEQEQRKQADIMFKHAADVHKAKETDFIRFKLNEHLKTADTDNFDINTWMSEMKQAHPAMFESEQQKQVQKPAASSGLPPAPAATATNVNYSNVAAQRDYSARGKKERDNAWEAHKRSIGQA